MENVLIELQLPAAERIYDVFIPRFAMLCDVLLLLRAVVAELSEGTYQPSYDALLCTGDGTPLDINMSVDNAGIRNGTRLMLI